MPQDIPQGITAAELMGKEFPELSWIVDRVIPEGLSLLCGKPKTGKSSMSQNIGVATALGGKALSCVNVKKGDVIYLALEDTERRLKTRLNEILENGKPPENFLIYTDWPKLDKGGLTRLQILLKKRPLTRLLIIDTLQRVRPKKSSKSLLYEDDYHVISNLKQLADKHNVAVVVIHHLRKTDSEDPLDLVSGSTGLTGAADTILVAKRARGSADVELHVTGRDVEENELALKPNGLRWTLLGDAKIYRQSQIWQEIIEVLAENEEPLSPAQIAKIINKDRSLVNHRLISLVAEGLVNKQGVGLYILNTYHHRHSCHSSHSRHSYHRE